MGAEIQKGVRVGPFNKISSPKEARDPFMALSHQVQGTSAHGGSYELLRRSNVVGSDGCLVRFLEMPAS